MIPMIHDLDSLSACFMLVCCVVAPAFASAMLLLSLSNTLSTSRDHIPKTIRICSPSAACPLDHVPPSIHHLRLVAFFIVHRSSLTFIV